MKPKFCASPSVVSVATILGSIAVLAVMGLVFCWAHSERLHDIGDAASRWHYFNRQAVWNVLGLLMFGMAIIAGWKRWLRAAPFVFAGWVALWFVAHAQPVVDGSCNFVRMGPISLGVWSLFPVAFALLAAWLRKRYGDNAKRILFIACVVALAAVSVHIATDANQMTHLAAFFEGERTPDMSPGACARAFVQVQTRKALAQAQWFSSIDMEILRHTPGNMNYSMPASSAVMFGKWFMSAAWGFFALIALCLAFLWRRTEDKAKRVFLLVSGLGIIVPTMLGHCQCLGFVPMLYIAVPIVSNDTTAVLATWLGAGILVSAVVDAGKFAWSRADCLAQET